MICEKNSIQIVIFLNQLNQVFPGVPQCKSSLAKLLRTKKPERSPRPFGLLQTLAIWI